MSFTNPLWNDMLFEKINQMHQAYMELTNQMTVVQHRMNLLENKLVNISNVVSHMSSLFSSSAAPQSHSRHQEQHIQSIHPVKSQQPIENNSTNSSPISTQTTPSAPPGIRIHEDSKENKTDNSEREREYNDTHTDENEDRYEGEWTKVSRKRK